MGLLSLVLLAAACARMEAPGGGPEDRAGPRVIEHAPPAGAVRVAADAPLAITFSEGMQRASVRDGLRIAPWPGKLACDWDEDRLTCTPLEGWRPATTYTVLLGSAATDRRRNPLETPLLFAFSTGDSLARGRLVGTLRTRSLGAAGVGVFLFAWPAELEGPLEAEAQLRPDLLAALRVDETDAEGGFEFPFVPSGQAFLAAALHDRNGNRAFDEDEDLWGFAEYAVTVADSGAGVDSVALYLVFADEEGNLAGSVGDAACATFVAPRRLRAQADSLGGMLTGDRDATGFARGEVDSLPPIELTAAERESVQVALERLESRLAAAVAESVRCLAPVWVSARRAGDEEVAAEVRCQESFELAGLAPGVYRLEAFRDLDGDGLPGPDEPAGAYPEAIRLKPGRRLEGLQWALRVLPPEEEHSGGD